jgi:hypothetical protein
MIISFFIVCTKVLKIRRVVTDGHGLLNLIGSAGILPEKNTRKGEEFP